MDEFQEALAEIESLMAELDEERTIIKNAQAIAKKRALARSGKSEPEAEPVAAPPPVKKRGFGQPKGDVSIADGAEPILDEFGPLHLMVLKEKMEAKGFSPTLSSLDTALRRDKKGRYKLTGAARTYGLTAKH